MSLDHSVYPKLVQSKYSFRWGRKQSPSSNNAAFVARVHGLLSNNVLRFSRSTFIISSQTRIWHLNLVVSAIDKAEDVKLQMFKAWDPDNTARVIHVLLILLAVALNGISKLAKPWQEV
jgi:hypothetical protein